MLSSLFARKVINCLADDHLVINTQKCLNNIKGYSDCTICHDTCPDEIIGKEHADYSKCMNCNLCGAVCPTQAIHPANSLIKTVLDNINAERHDIFVSCEKQDLAGSINIKCFASMPWEIYALLVQKKRILVSFSECEACDYYMHMKNRLKEVIAHIGVEQYKSNFIIKDRIEGNGISRRELMLMLGERSTQIVKKFIFDEHVNSDDSLFYRRFLLKNKDNVKGKRLKLFWKTLGFNEKCWGCGICISECPNEALELIGNKSMAHYPVKCTQCRSCIKKCPEEAIDRWKEVEAYIGDEIKVITDIKTTKCPLCESLMKPKKNYYFCYYCGNKVFHD